MTTNPDDVELKGLPLFEEIGIAPVSTMHDIKIFIAEKIDEVERKINSATVGIVSTYFLISKDKAKEIIKNVFLRKK